MSWWFSYIPYIDGTLGSDLNNQLVEPPQVPFSLLDWPNPPQSYGFVGSQPVPQTFVVEPPPVGPAPFAQYDYPNPEVPWRGPDSQYLDLLNALLTSSSVELPNNLYDWQVPTVPRPVDRASVVFRLPLLAPSPQKPFGLYDWPITWTVRRPVPLMTRVRTKGHQTVAPGPMPFTPRDFPNPRPRLNWVAEQKSTSYLVFE